MRAILPMAVTLSAFMLGIMSPLAKDYWRWKDPPPVHEGWSWWYYSEINHELSVRIGPDKPPEFGSAYDREREARKLLTMFHSFILGNVQPECRLTTYRSYSNDPIIIQLLDPNLSYGVMPGKPYGH